VAVAVCTVAAVPLNFTVLSVGVVLKFVPLIVTVTPAIPEVGEMEVTVGGTTTGGGGGGGGGGGVGVGLFFVQAAASNNKSKMLAKGHCSSWRSVFMSKFLGCWNKPTPTEFPGKEPMGERQFKWVNDLFCINIIYICCEPPQP
jgi:hypothetical protein